MNTTSYVQPTEFNQHSDLLRWILIHHMEWEKTKQQFSVLLKLTTHYMMLPLRNMTVLMHLLHHNTTANITIATQSPYLALVSSGAKPHNKSAANNDIIATIVTFARPCMQTR